MKLRNLELENVRRFGSQKAQLGPFGDGLTTIVAENESGKSTFFDALHALLFVAHSSSSQEVKNLQPYSGGAVSVAAEIEIDGKDFRIEKTFNAQKSAKIIDCSTGQILKQQGDAEAWIEENVNKINKGPAGLLWVRQGATHVDPQGRDKDANNISVRRDLMSSVRGQIDAVTGGRRMDKIVERCRKELDALATRTLKAKAGGPWKQIEEKVEELQTQKDRLQKDVVTLAQALEIKRRTRVRLRELQDVERLAERDQKIVDAVQALKEAESHDQKINDSERALELVKAEKDRLIRRIDDIIEVQDRRRQLSDDIQSKQEALASANSEQKVADTELKDAQFEIAEKETARRELVSSLRAARQAEQSRQKRHRLLQLWELFQQLEAPQVKLNEAEGVLKGSEISQADLDHLSDLARRISVAQEQRGALFARFSVRPTGSNSAEIDGETLQPNNEILLDRPIDLHVSGFGDVCLRPAEVSGKGIEDPETLLGEQIKGLEELGFETLQLARDAFSARQRALNEKQVALAEIRGLAPDGIDALNEEWQSLCVDLGHPPNEQPVVSIESQTLELSVEQIEETIANLDDELEELRSNIISLQLKATETASKVAEANGVLKHLTQERAALLEPEDEAARLQALELARDKESKKEVLAQQAFELLKQDAPNLEAARSAHERLLEAEKGDRDEINRLERELARANGAIETQSEGAVEEKLAEVEGQIGKAVERAGRYEMRVKALAMLIQHLEAARRDAQETYFEPIRNELLPLLAQLHAGADFELDPEKMLIGKIIRNGVEDDIDVLSGGAYEQIAILTRLAFARLFAKQGRHVPVILDDALVHTDDERISTMFNMLSQVARDQQIIVLSCRTRAFSDLGGTRAFIDTEAV